MARTAKSCSKSQSRKAKDNAETPARMRITSDSGASAVMVY
jgi:hypothetical protein